MGEHLTIILKEMCSRVGASYDDVDFKDEEWFLKYEWSDIEENYFIEWLANYLYKNKAAREELLRFPIKNKNKCIEAANQFSLNYGWKTKRIDTLK